MGRLSNWSRTGVVGIFYFQPKLYFSKGNFSLDKYQCVPVYQANYLQRKYNYFWQGILNDKLEKEDEIKVNF